MLKVFYPYEYEDSVFSIDYQKLYDLGYRGIIFDIDNTLVPHGKDSTAEVDELFRRIHGIGLKTLLLSNNNEARILRFLANIDSLYICEADKPHPEGYLKAVEMLGLQKEEVVCIGDQVFTDILGANRSGIDSILVHYIRRPGETKIGIRRHLENMILKCYSLDRSSQHRIGDIRTEEAKKPMHKKKKKLFCEINPLCYAISLQKGICTRHVKNFLSKEKPAKTIQTEKLPNLVASYSCNLIKRAPGIDLRLQENKATNIKLACGKINGLVIHPGQMFSFWQTVGKPSKHNGYQEGRVIKENKLIAGVGGGLCNLGNAIHRLVLHSPLKVTEFHSHSDALGPDEGKRVIFSAGTSISYNYIDFRFKNTTDQDVQLLCWCADDRLYTELRSQSPFPCCYELVEEDHHFHKEAEKYYRISKIYRQITDRQTGAPVGKELVWDNHSEVMYDHSLIPADQIR